MVTGWNSSRPPWLRPAWQLRPPSSSHRQRNQPWLPAMPPAMAYWCGHAAAAGCWHEQCLAWQHKQRQGSKRPPPVPLRRPARPCGGSSAPLHGSARRKSRNWRRRWQQVRGRADSCGRLLVLPCSPCRICPGDGIFHRRLAPPFQFCPPAGGPEAAAAVVTLVDANRLLVQHLARRFLGRGVDRQVWALGADGTVLGLILGHLLACMWHGSAGCASVDVAGFPRALKGALARPQASDASCLARLCVCRTSWARAWRRWSARRSSSAPTATRASPRMPPRWSGG